MQRDFFRPESVRGFRLRTIPRYRVRATRSGVILFLLFLTAVSLFFLGATLMSGAP